MKWILILSSILTVLIISAASALFLDRVGTLDYSSFSSGSMSIAELGDFVAGVFSPIAFLWLIVTMTMQRKELGLQREALKAQLNEMEETRNILKGESDYLRESTQAQKEVVVFQRMNALVSQVHQKAKYIVERNREILPTKSETALDSINRYIKESIDVGDLEVLKLIVKQSSYIELRSLAEKFHTMNEGVFETIFVELSIYEFIEIDRKMGGTD